MKPVEFRGGSIPPKSTFHKDHVKRLEYHDMIVQVDGVHFWASRDMLVEKSDFFRDVEDVVGAEVSNDAPIVIRELPSATPDSLALVLLLIEVVSECRPQYIPERSNLLRSRLEKMSEESDFALLGDFYTTADVYGFDELPVDLYLQIMDFSWVDTIASLAAKKRPFRLAFFGPPKDILADVPPGAEALLNRLAPDWRQQIKKEIRQ